jgi:wyosine [tRNA(Phe)-imidazoG37] synthetase (radical SAM superfamily)
MLFPLQEGILYGPISSRRLGKSLGINLMPGRYKLCSFDCVYCHYGPTHVSAIDLTNYREDLPSVVEVLDAVEKALKSTVEYAYLTFSGNGEPTLHPHFHDIVTEIDRLRKKYRPHVKVALLSNSSGLYRQEVQESVPFIDLPVFKLDAGDEDTFKKINMPARDVDFQTVVASLQAVKDIYLQTVLMAGLPSNVEEGTLASYFKVVSQIKPRGVQIYSLDRPVPNKKIERVRPVQLKEIATRGTKETGVMFSPFYV